MNKSDILKHYTVEKFDNTTVFIKSKYFEFSYTISDNVVKEEYKGVYRYLGGLQCNFSEDSIEYHMLEKWLVQIAENILGVNYIIEKEKILDKYISFNSMNEYLKPEIYKAMNDYGEVSSDLIYELFNKPAEILKPLEDLYRKEFPMNKFYIPDRTQFYKWIKNKILC